MATPVQMSESVRGGRGWNDPPKVSFPVQCGSQRSTLTRSRVPEIKQTAEASSGDPPLPLLLPPSPPYNAPPLVPLLVPTVFDQPERNEPSCETGSKDLKSSADLEIPDFATDEQLFNYIMSKLHKSLKLCDHCLKAKSKAEISRKLELFEQMWQKEMLSQEVKLGMSRLTTAVDKREIGVAQQIHMQLMMEHISEVGGWMVAVKKLIQEVEGLGAVEPVEANQTIEKQDNKEEVSDVAMTAAVEVDGGESETSVNRQGNSGIDALEPHATSDNAENLRDDDVTSSVSRLVDSAETKDSA